ncbi:MAG: hypothetical protein ACI35W_05485 [Anaeroplasmataceae bacterium]
MGVLKKKTKVAPRVLYMKNGKIALEFTYEEYKALKDTLNLTYYDLENDELALKGQSSYNFWKTRANTDFEKEMLNDSKKDIKRSILLRGIDDTTPFVYSNNDISVYSDTPSIKAYARSINKGNLLDNSLFDLSTNLPRDFETFEKQYKKKYPYSTYQEVINAYKKRAKFGK